MKYECGPFIYDLPETSCVFCKHADIIWDYTHGIYAIWCDEGYEVTDLGKMAKDCKKREVYEDETISR